MTRRRRALQPTDVGTLDPTGPVHFDVQTLEELANWLKRKAEQHRGMPVHVELFERFERAVRVGIIAHDALGDRLVEHDAEYRAHLGTCHGGQR